MKALAKWLPLLPTTLGLAISQAQAGALSDLYRQAEANDPQLKAAQATTDADREALAQARAGLLPTISLDADLRQVDSDPGGLNDGSSHGYSLSLSQPVYRAENWYNYQRGKVLDEQALISFSQAQQSLVLRTVEAYLAVLDAQSDLETSLAEEKAIKRRLDQVQVQFEVGLIAITDVQEAQAAYDGARVNRILAEGTLDNSFEALERLTGQAQQAVPRLAADYPIDALTPSSSQPWVDKALAENLELTISRLSTEAARQTSKIGRAGHQPTLDLTASYGSDDTPIFDGDSGQIALVFNLPLYTGGQVSSVERETQARWRASQQLEEDTRRQVVETTRNLFRDLLTDIQAVKARRQLVKSGEIALEATAAGFEVGTRNVVDVLDAERQLFAARRDLATARHKYVRDLFRFKQAVGTLAPQDLESLDRWMRDR